MIEPFDLLALARALLGFAVPIAALAWTAWVAGRTVLAWLAVEVEDPVERFAIASTVGLAALAHVLLGLGLAGELRPVPVLALVVAAHVAAVASRVSLAPSGPAPRSVALGALVALPFALPALYPDTGFDSRMYHLPYVHAFARTGCMPFLPDLRFPIFPQASEALSTALVLFGSEASASGTGLLSIGLAALLVAAWGRRAFPSWPGVGSCAASIFLGSPLVGYLASVLYVDPLLGLFSTAALLAIEHLRARGERGWIAVAAALAASAADVKYLGLYTIAVTALAVAFTRPRGLALHAAVAIVVLAPWYARILASTGSPIFPFLPSIFGATAWTPVPEPPATLGARLVNASRMAFDLVFARERWNRMPPISPVFGLAVPVVILAAARRRRIAWWSTVIGLFVLIYQWLPKSAAYTAMWLPLASLTVAGSVATVCGRRLARRRRATLVVTMLCLAPGWLYGFYTVVRHGPLPVTEAARERYLDQRLPLHAAVAFLNRTQGSGYTVWAVDAEHLTDFARGRFLGDTNGRGALREQVAELQSLSELRDFVLGLGVRYVLVPSGAGPVPPLFRSLDTVGSWPRVYRDRYASVYEVPGDVP